MAVFTSCEDYLEPAPTSVISGTSFYADEAQLMQGVYNMYDGCLLYTSPSPRD